MKVFFTLICFFLMLNGQLLFSQVSVPKTDSSKVYNSIQNYSKKKKFTTFLHKLVFRPVNVKKRKNKIILQNFGPFEGKIIRTITITTLDPFGYSTTDTTQKPDKWRERTGNRIHVKTKKLVVKNFLLIKENDVLDSLLVKESERLLRAQRFINTVDVVVKPVSNAADSVDVVIRVLDSWSLIPRASFSPSQVTLKLNERNFMGMGHEFHNEYKSRKNDGNIGYLWDYTIPNIKNTFIKTNFKYQIDLDRYYSKSITIERPFYSAFTKWAGGIYVDQQFRKDTLPDSALEYASQNFKYNSQDYWVGHAFSIFKGNTPNNRTTNLIVSGRYLHINYLENPTAAYDPINFYSDEKLYLMGIGITSQKFVQDKYIFRNGVVEDIPIGKIYGITSGYQYKNSTGRFYLGARASLGNYYSWGFLSVNMELGTFFEKSNTSQTAFTFQANYFTNLMHLGDWKIRQFIKPQFIIGSHRLNAIGDSLTLNEQYGIEGFNSALYGTQKMVLTLQTQAYSPWNVWGFRLNPYFSYSLGYLGTPQKHLNHSQPYSKIGIGLIINNDFLVFSSFQISLAYFPNTGTNGDSNFRTNTFDTDDFGLQDFELAKPRTVIFK
ncbi:BamA/TamA family outer membrane protein [Flavobacterium restrictum]|nr:hypothetical protein [Flavobacterium restrictum]